MFAPGQTPGQTPKRLKTASFRFILFFLLYPLKRCRLENNENVKQNPFPCTHCPSKQHPLPIIFISSFHRTAPFDQTITTELQILQKAAVPSFALFPFPSSTELQPFAIHHNRDLLPCVLS